MSVLLSGTNVDGDVHLQLAVVAYEFPREPYDDWCLVRVDLRHHGRSFETTDPALEAPDLIAIRDWFRALAENRLPRFAQLTFIEPCLAFEYLSKDESGVRFAVRLNHELRPPFPLRQLGCTTTTWNLVMTFDEPRLAETVERVETTMREFAVRSHLPPADP